MPDHFTDEEVEALKAGLAKVLAAGYRGYSIAEGNKVFFDFRFDAIRRLLARLEQAEARVGELEDYAREATKAITGLTVGGSEFFGKRIGEIYTADLPYCVEHIRDRDRRNHERLVAALKEPKP